MKNKFKIILLYLIIFILVGCDLNNTPTSKVEELLSNYQMLSEDINVDEKILFLTNGDVLTEKQKIDYKGIVTKQYKSLSYNVKDETVDGDNAIVEVQIEVMNYKDAIDGYSMNVDKNTTYLEQYHKDRIEAIKGVRDKSTYTIEFLVVKDDDGKWKLDNLSSVDEQKLLGIY